MRTKSLKSLLFTLTSISSLQGQIDERTHFIITQNGHPIEVILSCDELYCKPASGEAAHRLVIADQEDFGATVVKAQQLGSASQDRLDLVLYPSGQEGNLKARLILQRKITVTMEAGASAQKIAEAAGAVSFETPDYAPGFLILSFNTPGESLKMVSTVSRLTGVKAAEVMVARSAQHHFVPNDPLYTSHQWHLKNTGQAGGTAGIDINIESVWDTYKGSGITIGVVDDGFDLNHPDLQPNFDTTIDQNWNDGDADDPSPRNATNDHGTPCAGIAGGKGNNGEGGSGVAPESTLVAMRLTGEDFFSDQDRAESASWQNETIAIKSNSWGAIRAGGGLLEGIGPLYRAALENSLIEGRGGLGTIHLRSAGNSGLNDDSNWEEMNRARHTISVGAVGPDGVRTDFTRPGVSNLISAPGVDIATTAVNGGTEFAFGGTSAACPIVAGVCALMLEANPDLGWRDVQEILAKSAQKVDPTNPQWQSNSAGFHFNHLYGAGMVDAGAAVALAENWVNLGPEQMTEVSHANLGLMIPDKGALIGSAERLRIPFSFSGSDLTRVEHAVVKLDLQHREWGQIQMRLISPDGTSSLMSPSTEFSLGSWRAGWELLSLHHWGELSQGTWYLELTDGVNGRTGMVNTASLSLFGSSAVTVTEAPIFTNASLFTGNVESSFEEVLTSTNGATSFSVDTLPEGLVLDEQSGFITGSPSDAGTYAVNVSATNGAGTSSKMITIQVDPRIPTPPSITSGNVVGRVGQALNYQIETDYAVSSYSSSLLPAGLSLNSTTGEITGTPTSPSTRNVTLRATNIDDTGQRVIVFTIYPTDGDTYGMALDTNDFFFFTGGDANWFVQNSVTTTGSTALQAGAITAQQWPALAERSTIWTFVEGPGVVSFDWRSSAYEGEGLAFLLVKADAEEIETMIPTERLSGQSNWIREAYIIPEGRHLLRWYYTTDNLGEYTDEDEPGMSTGWLDHFKFTSELPNNEIPLAEAIDYQGFVFRSEDIPWIGQDLHSFDGVDAVRSPEILNRDTSASDYAKTSMSTNVTGPGTFSFQWKLDAYAFTNFYALIEMDGTLIEEIQSNEDWALVTIEVPAGDHEIKWSYEKDGLGFARGLDSLLIDQLRWAPAGTSKYEQWVGQSFPPAQLLANEGLATEDDFDGDTYSNLFEYFFRLNPLVSDGSGVMTLNHHQDKFSLLVATPDPEVTGVMMELEVSRDLKTWDPVDYDTTAEGDRFRLRPRSVINDRKLGARLKLTLSE